ncbi:hypothetical protein PF005_g5924 [Phytophthora fragariae]|uniref:Myb/SANT-like domain-containing protein n=1 Tax=Phytophthora fragariae TaxID=53985 RepID=A0A6A3LNV8_9STRA|nr:hypothetical protein PF003_g6617 [Phytophthora fragariae]KAE8943713.1 hypothetical protein PF009_g6583 [Phytophthora fragariae]KAE9021231.1 hypothetical protein PF011_g5041 [Phytophthora fragariae]KAE9126158.1 hypothetical protein PF007_g6087 [Phytophthora fragariae]KAE9126402.1 hypothetical protein PF010_g5281 [Phytophthora fragariae]
MYSAASPPLATNALLASIALLDESTASLHQTQSGAGELMSGSGLAVTAARQSAPTEASLAGTGQDGTAKSTASWNDEDVEELFRLRYKVLDGRFKNTKDTKRIKFAWSVLASTLSVNQSKVFTDQQCQSKVTPYTITCAAQSTYSFQSVEAGLSAVAKGFCEGLEALGKGLAVAQSDGGDGPAAAVQQQTEIFRQQSEVANDQNTQFLLQIQAQSERLKLQNDNIRELLDLIRRDGASN